MRRLVCLLAVVACCSLVIGDETNYFYSVQYGFGTKVHYMDAINTTMLGRGHPYTENDFIHGGHPVTSSRTGFEVPGGMSIFVVSPSSNSMYLALLLSAECNTDQEYCGYESNGVPRTGCGVSCRPESFSTGVILDSGLVQPVVSKSESSNPCCTVGNCDQWGSSTPTAYRLRNAISSGAGENKYLFLKSPYTFSLELLMPEGFSTITMWSQDINGNYHNLTVPIKEFGTNFRVVRMEGNDYCRRHATCSGCATDPRCGWCTSLGTCVAGTATGSSQAPSANSREAKFKPGPYISCPTEAYHYSSCPMCTSASSCTACLSANQGCEWCASDSKCYTGGSVPGCAISTLDSCSFPSVDTTDPLLLSPNTVVVDETFATTSSLSSWQDTRYYVVGGPFALPSPAWSQDSSRQALKQSQPTGAAINADYRTGAIFLYIGSNMLRWDRYVVEFDVTSGDKEFVGAVLNYGAANSNYALEWSTDPSQTCGLGNFRHLLLKKMAPGKTTSDGQLMATVIKRLTGFGYVPHQTYNIKAFVTWPDTREFVEISIFIDGKFMFTATDTVSPYTTPHIGLATIYNKLTHFDNFKIRPFVTDLSLGTPITTALTRSLQYRFTTGSSSDPVLRLIVRSRSFPFIFSAKSQFELRKDSIPVDGLSDLVLKNFGSNGALIASSGLAGVTQGVKSSVYFYTILGSDYFSSPVTSSYEIAVNEIGWETLALNMLDLPKVATDGYYLAKLSIASSYASLKIRIDYEKPPMPTCATSNPCVPIANCTDVLYVPPFNPTAPSCSCPPNQKGDGRIDGSGCVTVDPSSNPQITSFWFVKSGTLDELFQVHNGTILNSNLLPSGFSIIAKVALVASSSSASWRAADLHNPNTNYPVGPFPTNAKSSSYPFAINGMQSDTFRTWIPPAGVTGTNWLRFFIVANGQTDTQDLVFSIYQPGHIVPSAYVQRTTIPTATSSLIKATASKWESTELELTSVQSGEEYFVAVDTATETMRFNISVFVDAPSITSVDPASADTTGGIACIIRGNNFGPAAQGRVDFSGTSLAVTDWRTDRINVEIPAGEGTKTIVVLSNGSPSVGFLFSYDAPVIGTVSPTVPTSGGKITISGSNFGFLTSVQVKIGGKDCTVSLLESTQHSVIVCNAPEGSGTKPLEVDVASISTDTTFVYAAPQITSTIPTLLPTSSSLLSIFGTSFGSATPVSVQVAGLPCTLVNQLHNRITCMTSSNNGGASNPTVVVTADLLVSNTFAMAGYEAPSVAQTLPPSGPTQGEDLILIGSNFGKTTPTVQFTRPGLTVPCSVSHVSNHTHIVCSIEAGTGSNLFPEVTRSGQSSTLHESTSAFSYFKPDVSQVIPAVGPTTGFSIAIHGKYFGASTGSVLVGGVVAAVTSWSDTQVLAEMPAGQGSAFAVTVTAHSGGDTNNNVVNIGYAAPNITGITPSSELSVLGGDAVTIKGTNFGSLLTKTNVLFQGVGPAVVDSVTHTEIRIRTPVGRGSLVPVLVTIGASNDATTKFNTLNPASYINYAAAVIHSISPTSMFENDQAQTQLTITGANFGNSVASVKIGLFVCATPSISDHEILCTIDQRGQGRNLPVVVSIAGTDVVSPQNFSYPRPRLSSVVPSPNPVPALGGTFITMNGAFFGTRQIGNFRVEVKKCAVFDDTAFTLSPPSAWTFQTALLFGDGYQVANVDFDPFATVKLIPDEAGPETEGLYEIFIGYKDSSMMTGRAVVTVITNSTSSYVQEVSQKTVADEMSSWHSIGEVNLVAGSTLNLTATSPGHLNVDGAMACRLVSGVNVPDSSVEFLSDVALRFPAPLAVGKHWLPFIKTTDSIEQRSSAHHDLLFDYAAPELTRVFGCAQDVGNTTRQCSLSGTTTLGIQGQHFGLSDILGYTAVSVHIKSLSYPCSNLKISSDSLMTCVLPSIPEGGFDVDVILSVGGQTVSKPLISFSGPEITAGTLRSCSEAGGSASLTLRNATQVCFEATNIVSVANLEVYYGLSTYSRLGTSIPPHLFQLATNAPLYSNPETGLWFPCLSVSMSAGSVIHCTPQAHIGSNFKFVLRSSSQWSPLGTDTLSFISPSIVNNTIRGSLFAPAGSHMFVGSSSLGSYVVFDVQNAAVVNSSLWGLASVEYSNDNFATSTQCSAVEVYDEADEKYTYNSTVGASAIRCLTAFGSGTGYQFTVTVLGQASGRSNDTYSYPTNVPAVTAVEGCVPGQSYSATYECPTRGGILLTIYGEDFCEDVLCATTLLAVKIGVRTCSNPNVLSPTKLTCVLPEGNGQGASTAIVVSTQTESSVPVQLLSYGSAVITAVSGCADVGASTTQCPVSGGTLITISGTNFGETIPTVLIGFQPCPNVTFISPHTKIQCVLPPGTSSQAIHVIPVDNVIVSSLDFPKYKAEVHYALCDIGTYFDTTQCSTCSAGRFTNQAGQTSCQLCPSGYFGESPGASSCSPCTPGKFSTIQAGSDTGPRNCSICPKGTYAPGTSRKQCIPCSAGSYAPEVGSTSCISCLIGRHAPDTGGTKCIDCPAGRESSGTGSERCIACPPGSISPSAASNCTQCPPGKYQDLEAGSFCKECEKGFAQRSSGQVGCLACVSGRFANATGLDDCYLCEIGKAYGRQLAADQTTAGAEECQPCGLGEYIDKPGLSSCLKCDVGRFANVTASTVCLVCPPGRRAAVGSGGIGATRCDRCESGRFSSGEINTCVQCSPGTYADAGQSICRQCEIGRFQSQSLGSSCDACHKGRYSNIVGQRECKPCAGGYIANTTGATICHACPAGKLSAPGSSECASCMPGTYSGGEGLSGTKCQDCDPGKFSNVSEASTCSRCQPGTFSEKAAATICAPCARGKYTPSIGSISCFLCSEGSIAVDLGRTSCVDCEPGRFSNVPASSQCFTCKEGRFTDQPGSGRCTPCLAGSYSPGIGSNNCTACPVGRYNTIDEATSCQLCDPGTISSSSQQTACIPCEKGKYSASQGGSVCLPCIAGQYSGFSASACINCTAGTFSASAGQALCADCEPGRFTSTGGQSVCTKCERGRFSKDPRGVTCESCPAGTYASSFGLSACISCSPGFFTNASGEFKCSACPRGSVQPSSGRTSCLPCTVGSYSPVEAQANCISCSAGTSTNTTGQTVCRNCDEGFYQLNAGQSTCNPCPAGHVAGGQASRSCSACVPGRFAAREGLPTCQTCPGGRFNAFHGESRCDICPIGQFSNPDSQSCQACPVDQVAPVAGSPSCSACPPPYKPNSDQTQCICVPGFFFQQLSVNNSACIQCPEGADCSLPGARFDSLTALPGYWRASPSSLVFYKCLQQSHCLGGRMSTCGTLRRGPLCAVCEDNAQVAADGSCVMCQGNTSLAVMIIVLFVVCMMMWVVYWAILFSDRLLMKRVKQLDKERISIRRRNQDWRSGFDQMAEPLRAKVHQVQGYRPVGRPNLTYKIKIIVGFFQIATNITTYLEMPWPRTFLDFISVFNLFNLDFVQWSSAECVANIGYYSKLVLVTTIPMILLLGITVLFLLPYYCKFPAGLPILRHWQSESQMTVFIHTLRRKRKRRKYWKLILFTLFLVYPQVSSYILRMHVCKRVEGVDYLVSDFANRCYDSEWNKYLPYNIAMIILYPIGVPAFFLYLLLRYKSRFRFPEVRMQIGFLYDGFASDMWFFELMDMFHKLILTSILPFLPLDAQLPVGMCVVFLHAITILLKKPYYRKGDDRLHLFAQVELFLLLLGGYVFYVTRSTLTDQDDVIMSIFLIAVVTGFVVVFVTQSYKIINKMLSQFKSKVDERGGLLKSLRTTMMSLRSLMAGESDSSDLDEERDPVEGRHLAATSSSLDLDTGLNRTDTTDSLQRAGTAQLTTVQLSHLVRSDVTADTLMSRNPLHFRAASGEGDRERVSSVSRKAREALSQRSQHLRERIGDDDYDDPASTLAYTPTTTTNILSNRRTSSGLARLDEEVENTTAGADDDVEQLQTNETDNEGAQDDSPVEGAPRENSTSSGEVEMNNSI